MGHQTDQSSCIALYGCDAALTPESWLRYAERYFLFLGVVPSVCVIASRDGRSRRVKWKSVRGKLSAPNEITSVSCYLELKESTSLFNWEAAAVWSLPIASERPSVFFGYGERLGKFSVETCGWIIRNVLTEYHAAYGIGYARENAKGPEAYAIGMPMGLTHSDAHNIERKKIGRWAREFSAPYPGDPERHRYLNGMLRDIYPITILSSAHMGRLVGEVSLRTWIEQSNTHGILNKINESNWMWIIDTENIPCTRLIFGNSQLLIVDVDCFVASA